MCGRRSRRRRPELDIETAQLMEDLIGDLTSVPQPIEVKLYSEDDSLLRDLAPKVADAIAKVNGVVEVVNGIIPAGDAFTIQVDRVKAGLEGVDPDGLTKSIQEMLEGDVTTQIQTRAPTCGSDGSGFHRGSAADRSGISKTCNYGRREMAICFRYNGSQN